jgi:NifU-like protein
MEFFLKLEDSVIKDATLQAIGCASAFSSGSALCDMIRGKMLEEAEKIEEEDIIAYLDGVLLQKSSMLV